MQSNDISFLELNMEHPISEYGYYHLDTPLTYEHIHYRALPMSRVFWSSPDSFTVYHQGFPITEPIVNYSTYTSEDSTGQQMVYLYHTEDTDTLTVTACTEDICKNLFIIIN